MKRLLGTIGLVFMVAAGIAIALPRAEALAFVRHGQSCYIAIRSALVEVGGS